MIAMKSKYTLLMMANPHLRSFNKNSYLKIKIKCFKINIEK